MANSKAAWSSAVVVKNLNAEWSSKPYRTRTGKTKLLVLRYVSGITPDICMELSAYFVQVADPTEDLAKILYHSEPLSNYIKSPSNEHILIQNERQSFTRLPISNRILFTVKATLQCLTEFTADKGEAFKIDDHRWLDGIAEYKGKQCWGSCALEYIL